MVQPALDLVTAEVQAAPSAMPETTWSAPEAVLWDNGPLVTHAGACSGVDASRLQSDLLMNTLGFGHQFSAGYRVADDFTITDPGGWQIDTITFFAYQTGAPASPSPITGVYYQIWDGPPDDPASSVVFGDLSTNRLLSSTFTNIQRDSTSSPCANSRYILADAAGAGLTLPAGTYWIDWTTDGSASYSGPWAPPVTILGQTTTGNGLHYTGAWGPANDSGTVTQQDLPFVIEGSVFEAPVVAQIESWDPAHLALLDWQVSGGEVITGPGRLEWTAELIEPATITLTKWFHVEPCTWTQTTLLEELWLDEELLEERPVVVNKLQPELWIDAVCEPAVTSGLPAIFTLVYSNTGGYENNAGIYNNFPPEAPFLSSVPPPGLSVPTTCTSSGTSAICRRAPLAASTSRSISPTTCRRRRRSRSGTISLTTLSSHSDAVSITLHVESPVVWDKYVDGIPWTAGMSVTHQTSDTIEVVEVLHLLQPPTVVMRPAVEPVHAARSQPAAWPPAETTSGAQPARQVLPVGTPRALSAGGLLYLTSLNIGNSTFAVYDPATDAWTTLAPYETGCQMAVSASGQLYAYGYNTGTIDLYDPGSDTWTPVLGRSAGSLRASTATWRSPTPASSCTPSTTTRCGTPRAECGTHSPCRLLANAVGDYDPTADQYVIGQYQTTNAHRIDVHTWAITNYASAVGNGEWARFGVAMGNRFYFEAGGSNVHSFDLASPAAPPVDHGVYPGWYTSAAADRANAVIYVASSRRHGAIALKPGDQLAHPAHRRSFSAPLEPGLCGRRPGADRIPDRDLGSGPPATGRLASQRRRGGHGDGPAGVERRAGRPDDDHPDQVVPRRAVHLDHDHTRGRAVARPGRAGAAAAGGGQQDAV